MSPSALAATRHDAALTVEERERALASIQRANDASPASKPGLRRVLVAFGQRAADSSEVPARRRSSTAYFPRDGDAPARGSARGGGGAMHAISLRISRFVGTGVGGGRGARDDPAGRSVAPTRDSGGGEYRNGPGASPGGSGAKVAPRPTIQTERPTPSSMAWFRVRESCAKTGDATE